MAPKASVDEGDDPDVAVAQVGPEQRRHDDRRTGSGRRPSSACRPSSVWPAGRPRGCAGRSAARAACSIIHGPRTSTRKSAVRLAHRGAERDVAEDVEGREARRAARRGGGTASGLPLPEAGDEGVHDLLEVHAARALHEDRVARLDDARASAAAAASASAKWWSEPARPAGLACALDDVGAERRRPRRPRRPGRRASGRVSRWSAGPVGPSSSMSPSDRHAPSAGRGRAPPPRPRAHRARSCSSRRARRRARRAHAPRRGAAPAASRSAASAIASALTPSACATAGRGEEVRDEVRPGEREGHVHRPSSTRRSKRMPAAVPRQRSADTSKRRSCPEPHDATREALRERARSAGRRR